MSSYAGHTREHVCIICEGQKANSLENITWSELGKLNIQAKKVCLLVIANGRSLRSPNPFFYGKQLALFIQGKWRSYTMISRDSGIDREDFANAMSDRNVWNKIVQTIPTERAKWWWCANGVARFNQAQCTIQRLHGHTVQCNAFFFGWRSGPVTNFSLLLFRAFLKTYKKDWMSTWRRNACFSRGIVSSFIFLTR